MKKKLIQDFENIQAKKSVEGRKSAFPKFKVGDTVSVKYKITEGTTTRLQAFQGTVIAKSKSDDNYNATFTVRKMSSNIGVERKFVAHSPLVSSIEVMKRGVVRRAKLYYLRELTGKASRIKEKIDFSESSPKKSVAESKSEAKKEVKSEEKKPEVKAVSEKKEAPKAEKAEAKKEEKAEDKK